MRMEEGMRMEEDEEVERDSNLVLVLGVLERDDDDTKVSELVVLVLHRMLEDKEDADAG